MHKNKKDVFERALFDVEHALNLYASSYCFLPAFAIYDKEALEPYKQVIESCHIYLIGLLPVVEIVDITEESGRLVANTLVAGKACNVSWTMPPGAKLREEAGYNFLELANGDRIFPSNDEVFARLGQELELLNFKVKYIGQSYGEDGARNALDRLLKHETLQKIALKGVPDGYRLNLVLLEIHPYNQILTLFNPKAQSKDATGERRQAGIDKLFDINEEEQITLYEASLIKYFRPEFNIKFKDSFPSTNLKVLQDCYAKDFSAVIAEFCFDDIPFRLFSEAIEPAWSHMAHHDLHEDENRKVFFAL